MRERSNVRTQERPRTQNDRTGCGSRAVGEGGELHDVTDAPTAPSAWSVSIAVVVMCAYAYRWRRVGWRAEPPRPGRRAGREGSCRPWADRTQRGAEVRRMRQALIEPEATSRTKVFHAPDTKESEGPSGAFESRTAMACVTGDFTSTHAPLPPEYDDFVQFSVAP